MKMVMLTKEITMPTLTPGDTVHIALMQGEKETTYTTTKEAFNIWVQPVVGGFLMRNTHPDTLPGPLFFVDLNSPIEYIAAVTALLADDRL